MEIGDDPTTARAQALVWRAGLYMYQPGSAVVQHRLADTDEALHIARAAGDTTLAFRALHWRVWLLSRVGDYGGGLAAADEAIALITDEVTDDLVCRMYRAKAAVEMNAGIDSRPSLSAALAAARRCGDLVEATRVQAQLGFTLLTMGETAAARREMAEALEAAREREMAVDAVNTASNLGYAILLEGDPEGALGVELEVVAEAGRVGAHEIRYYAVLCVALARSALGQHELAATLHGALASELGARGDRLESFEAQLRDADLERLRAALGSEFERHYRCGADLAFDDAAQLARGS